MKYEFEINNQTIKLKAKVTCGIENDFNFGINRDEAKLFVIRRLKLNFSTQLKMKPVAGLLRKTLKIKRRHSFSINLKFYLNYKF
jgi:hypothetical protein